MNKYLAGILWLAPSLALAQTSAPTTYPYVIKGKLGKLNAPAKVYLITGVKATDSATLQRGRFVMKGTSAYPQSAVVVLERQGRLQSGFRPMMFGGTMRRGYVESPDHLRLFLEPGPVVVTSPDSLRTARVAGGALTADYQHLHELREPAVAQLKKARSTEQQLGASRALVQANLAFVRARPTSWVSLEALQLARSGGPPRYEEVAPLYAALTPAQRASPPGQQYGKLLDGLKAAPTAGKPAPAFTQSTPGGQPVALADYRGKYVLVDFWASWCGPCRAENPNLLKAHEAFKGRNFEILGVSLDQEKDRAKWVKAIADDRMPWAQVSDLRGFDSPVARQYGVTAIPQNFLVDPSGHIVATNLRGEVLATTLAKFIK